MASKPNPTFDSVKAEYAALWQSMTVRPDRADSLKQTAFRIASARGRYDIVSRATGIPWWFIGIVHQMECGLSWTQHLHNGDPLTARTKQVPAGRIPAPKQPPFAWEDSAVDALTMKGFDKITDWSLERVAYCFETYNGFGYRLYHSEIHSPYLWSFTTAYASGKYVADGVWSPTAVSGQPGAMAILKAMMDADPAIDPRMIADQPVVAFPKATGGPDSTASATPKTPSKVAVALQSKTVRHAVSSIAFGVVAKIKIACVLVASTIASGIDSVPDMIEATKDQKQAFVDLGNSIGTPEIVATVFAVLSVTSALIVIYRHTVLKHDTIAQQQGSPS